MLQYPQKIQIDVNLHYMVWRNVKNVNQILHIWNLWVKGIQTIYGLSKSVDILEKALSREFHFVMLSNKKAQSIVRGVDSLV